MKTSINLSIATVANKLYIAIIAIALGLSFTACTNSDDEPAAVGSSAKVTDAQITFTYTVPEELFRYAEITVCYNNNEGTDARWEPMLDNKFTVTYNITRFPVTAPVVLVYDNTNRPATGVNVDWDITMDTEVTMSIGGQKVTKTNLDTYTINGDLGAGLIDLQRNVLNRTFAVKISKNGDINFVH